MSKKVKWIKIYFHDGSVIEIKNITDEQQIVYS